MCATGAMNHVPFSSSSREPTVIFRCMTNFPSTVPAPGRQQNLPIFETFKELLMAAWANEPPGLLTEQPTNTL